MQPASSRSPNSKPGAFAIEPVHDDQTRQPQLLGGSPHLLGLHHHAADCVDDDQRRVCNVERGNGVGEEVPHARSVDEVDFLLSPFGVGEAGRECVLARYFLFVVVGDGRAVVDLAEAIHHAGVGEDGRSELCFPGSAVTDEGDIANAGGVVDLHTGPPGVANLRIIFPGGGTRKRGGRGAGERDWGPGINSCAAASDSRAAAGRRPCLRDPALPRVLPR